MSKSVKHQNEAPMSSDRQKKTAIYIRVSTLHQVDRDSLPMQRKDLTAYTSLILGIDDYDIFEDAGYSGKNTVRPAYQNMMSRMRKGEFSHLLVWKIDRISRNLIDFAEMYEELKSLNVVFVSKNEQFDTSTAIGEAMLKIILVFAELERKMTAERVTAAMISRATQGIWNGGRIPYGYSYDKDAREFSINESEAKICNELKDHYLRYGSLVRTAKFMNDKGYSTRGGSDWSPVSIAKILGSPFYVGTYRYNKYHGTENRTINPENEWIIIEDHHPAIFTLEEHQAMRRMLDDNTRLSRIGDYRPSQNIHVFGDICYCGKCGSKMTSTPGRLQADGYRTSTHMCPLKRKGKKCDNPSLNDLLIGEFLINFILNMINAKTAFSGIKDPDDLEKRLLYGSTFKGIKHIEPAGLYAFYDLLSRYGSDSSFSFSPVRRKPKQKPAVDPELATLRKDKEKHERALERLQHIYLYSDNAMDDKDFIARKDEIVSELAVINARLGMIRTDNSYTMSDEDLIRLASHLHISSMFKDRLYINYKRLVSDVSPDILKQYMDTIIDSVFITDGSVSSIAFRNGLVFRFVK